METFIVTKVSCPVFLAVHRFFPIRAAIIFQLSLGLNHLDMSPSGETRNEAGLKKVFRWFIQGLITLFPIAVTAWALYWLFDKVDGILRPYVNVPGLGFVIIIAFVILVGWISSNFLMGSFLGFFDNWMERAPGIKFIYSSTKDFFKAFAGEKKKFNQAILASVFAEDVWIVGFLTDEELQKFEMGADKVSVYVPQAYHWAGQLYILPRDKVRKIEKISAGDAMKYAVTGGVVEVGHEAAQVVDEKTQEAVVVDTPETIKNELTTNAELPHERML